MATTPREEYCRVISKLASEQKWQLALGPFVFCWTLPNGDKHQEFHYATNAKDALHAACIFFEKSTTTIEIIYE